MYIYSKQGVNDSAVTPILMLWTADTQMRPQWCGGIFYFCLFFKLEEDGLDLATMMFNSGI